MLKLSETLKELITESKTDYKTFAKQVGISPSRITDYINNDKLPTVENLIKIADYFDCSCNYLLGRDYEERRSDFNTPVPFAERLAYLKESLGFTHKQIYESEGISKSRYFDWLNGRRQPSLDNIIKLADLFECSVDFVLGRED